MQAGYVCVSIEYWKGEKDRWPRNLGDCKNAVRWLRFNADRYRIDPDNIGVIGGSAGGHLAALAGLTAGDPEFDAHLPEGSDTSVDAVVGIYGRYDWEDRSTKEREEFVDFQIGRASCRERVSSPV